MEHFTIFGVAYAQKVLGLIFSTIAVATGVASIALVPDNWIALIVWGTAGAIAQVFIALASKTRERPDFIEIMAILFLGPVAALVSFYFVLPAAYLPFIKPEGLAVIMAFGSGFFALAGARYLNIAFPSVVSRFTGAKGE